MYLGVDLGTSSVKAVLIGEEGTQAADAPGMKRCWGGGARFTPLPNT